MSEFVYGKKQYQRYLVEGQNAMRSEIEKQTRELIAQHEELDSRLMSIDEGMDRANTQLETITWHTAEVAGELRELNAAFQWGVSEILSALGAMQSSLDELIKIAKTPSQTWAYEQFEIARDALERGLYEEALEYATRAIEGYGDNTGYKLEFRFHFLVGIIRLGSHSNTSSDLIDLEAAEQAFIAAAKYAAKEQTADHSRALIAAGRASYCNGRPEVCLQHTKKAVDITPSIPEGWYQVAKVHAHLGQAEAMTKSLQTAIEGDPRYCLKVFGDDDFVQYRNDIVTLIEKLLDRIGRVSEDVSERATKQSNLLGSTEKLNIGINRQDESSNIESPETDLARLDTVNTYFGYLDFCRKLGAAQPRLFRVLEKLKKKAELTSQRAGEEEARASRATLSDWNGWRCFPLVLAFFIGLAYLWEYNTDSSMQTASTGELIFAAIPISIYYVIPAGAIALLVMTIAWGIIQGRKEGKPREAKNVAEKEARELDRVSSEIDSIKSEIEASLKKIADGWREYNTGIAESEDATASGVAGDRAGG